MENFDTNYVGLFAVPLGVLLGFGPALLVWLKEELGSGSSEDHKQGK